MSATKESRARQEKSVENVESLSWVGVMDWMWVHDVASGASKYIAHTLINNKFIKMRTKMLHRQTERQRQTERNMKQNAKKSRGNDY